MPRRLPENLVRRGKVYYFRQVVNGRLVRRSLGEDYEEAKRRLRSLKDRELPLERVTIEEVAKRWVESYVVTNRCPTAQRNAAQRVRDYLVPAMGHLLLERVRREDVRTYRIWLEKRCKAPLSVKHILSDLRCILNWAEDCGLVERSQFPRRIMPRIQERPPNRISDDELARIVVLSEPYGFICRFLVQTGLRWGEATRAQTTDIQNGMLIVHQTKSRKVRRVPIPPALQHELRGRVGRIVGLNDPEGLAKIVRREAEVPGFHAHQLRHTFACRWLEAGGSLAALQELLGHSSIVTTQRYGRLGEAHVQAEAARIAERLVTLPVTPRLQQNP